MLKPKILQKIRLKFDTPSVPCQSSFVRYIHEFVYVSASAPEQGRGQIETHCSKGANQRILH